MNQIYNDGNMKMFRCNCAEIPMGQVIKINFRSGVDYKCSFWGVSKGAIAASAPSPDFVDAIKGEDVSKYMKVMENRPVDMCFHLDAIVSVEVL